MKAALLYAQRFGWRVVPLHSVRSDGACTCGHLTQPTGACECGAPKCSKSHKAGSIGKHPRLHDWAQEASADAETIAGWGRSWPDANVGIATGSASGIFVLDVDPDKGGADSLARLVAEHGALPETAQAATGSGGSHYLFRMPGHPVTNSAGALGKGLDIRGDGGQIVAAPSRSGRGAYRWVRAPWDTPVAEAPAWLLERLRRAPGASKGAGPVGPRPYFPPAAPDVLQAAREALALHGPAVDGEGGGLHTVHAAAILTHDYALTDEEAWPLFWEWNASCVPPWETDDLAERLRRGRKYGKAEYGSKRPQDMVTAAQNAIDAWQAEGGQESGIAALVEKVRPLALACGDSTRHALIEKALCSATGLKPRALQLPKPRKPVEQPKHGEIRYAPDLHRVADESLRVVAPHVFARNGVLCEVSGGGAERVFISDLEVARVRDLMSRCSSYVRTDEKLGLVTMAAPEDVARILHARRTHPGVRVLEAVTNAPVFLADGSILQERGYNPEARLWLEPNVTVAVPSMPDREDARRAVQMFRDLLSDFRFASPADFSSWLAALCSPLVKAAIGNAPAPLVCISAASPGTGKTLLTKLIARIVTGADAEVRSYNPKDPAEHQKRITSFVRSAALVNVFDNINGAIGDETLDRLITSSTWSDRQLGASEAPPVPVVGTWLATGNNIEPVGDTVRRVLMVRIEVDTERPQEKTGFRIADIEAHVSQHRAELLSAALTILRAYHVAGRPAQPLAAWGSFTTWSVLVRGALVWAGLQDPFLTQQRLAAESGELEHDAHDFWLSIVPNTDGTVPAITLAANQRDAQTVLGAREPLTPRRLRAFLAPYIDRPRHGRRIRRVSDPSRGVVYRVEALP